VCRAISESPVPVVSAIGHEKDSPLSDFVADLRVSTPTAAARTVVPDYAELTRRMDGLINAMRRRSKERAQQRSQNLAHMRARLEARSPAVLVRDRLRYIAQLRQRLTGSVHAHIRTRRAGLQSALRARAMVRQRLQQTSLTLARDASALRRVSRSRIQSAGSHLAASASRLHALSPMRVLERGYAIVRADSSADWQDGAVIDSVSSLSSDQTISLQFCDGVQSAVVGKRLASDNHSAPSDPATLIALGDQHD
jgi:exodeoxyribonuclease VII large subunit